MSIELKIKAKHLALEPAIIRKEEQKLLKRIRSGKCNDTAEAYRKYQSLYLHRVRNVRYASRATHLARAYLNGMSYSRVEKKCDWSVLKCYVLPEVFRMIAKYGEKKLYKRWNNERKQMMYNEAEEKELMDAIMKWLKT